MKFKSKKICAAVVARLVEIEDGHWRIADEGLDAAMEELSRGSCVTIIFRGNRVEIFSGKGSGKK